MTLTVKELDAARPADKPYKLTVARGLQLRVAVDGTKRWLVTYIVRGKRRELRLAGEYGNVAGRTSLADAKHEAEEIRKLARGGVDIQERQEAERARLAQLAIEAAEEAERARLAELAAEAAKKAECKTVHDLFSAWIADGVARKDGNAELSRRFAKDVHPHIGGIELRNLTEHDLRAVVRAKIDGDGNGARMAQSTFDDIRQMLHWGEKRLPWRGLLINGNPADLVEIEKLLPFDYEEERDRVLSPAELRELQTIFAKLRESYANTPAGEKYEAVRPLKRETELAIWICLGTLCRIGELLMSEWKHVDLQEGTWFIPKANVKGRGRKKQDHHVFLSPFALRYFKELHSITGKSRWLFPASNQKDVDTHVCLKSVSKQVGDRQEQFKRRDKPLKRRRHDNTLVLAGGKNGDWTPHDMRRTGATMMQQLGIPLDIIDRCQNHVLPGSRVRRHYLHHDYRVEKTDAWNRLGDRLDAIFAGGAQIIPLRA
ncbi:MAG: tyrosine-type recombinase/integrase [Betaproteobacteria bacterium]|nr:tyrosine-type recombinase/integrase [Betaproteobacteria bacterium]